MVRTFLKLALYCLTGLVGYAGTAGAGDLQIRYGGQNIPSDIVSYGKDFGRQHGIDIKVDLFPSAGEASQALLAGRADVTDASSARLIALAAEQPGRIVIIGTHYYGGAMMSVVTAPHAPYRSVGDLKGKKIAAKLGTGSYSAFLKLIGNEGMKPGDFRFLNMNPPDMAVATQQGVVDAAVFWEPFPSVAVQKGLVRRLIDFDGVVDNPHFYITTREFAERHPEELTRFLAARADLARFIKKDLDEAASVMVKVQGARGIKVPPEVARETLKRMKLDFEVKERFFGELRESAEDMVKRGKVSKVPDLRKLVDDSYLRNMRQASVR